MQRFVLFIYYQIDTVQKKELDSFFSGDQGCYKNIFHPWFGSLFRHTQWGPVAHPISLRHMENYGQCPKNKQNHPQYVEGMVDVILKAVLGLS